jgi:hypothetical protein
MWHAAGAAEQFALRCTVAVVDGRQKESWPGRSRGRHRRLGPALAAALKLHSRGRIRCVCVFITAGPSTKLFTWGGGGDMGGHEMLFYLILPDICVCLLLQYLIQNCARGGRRIVEDMCYEIRQA